MHLRIEMMKDLLYTTFLETIFTLGDTDDSTTKINMDELYEHKQKKDLDTLSIYNRILSRIHNKIKIISALAEEEN